jgi:activator of 2-hydroxyglutaryl-CoA dehydratase
MVRALEERLSTTVVVPAACEHVCAIGAALLGFKRLDAQKDRAAEARLAEAL